MTRRDPPLEPLRQRSAGRSVHRSTSRWAVWLSILIALFAGAAFVGCKVLPEVKFARSLPLSRSSAPLDIENPDGLLARAERVRVMRKLASTGDTALLDYHLAAMQDIGAPPLLVGNGVKLLIDGPRTYHEIFEAIVAAREYVLVESFIFEEAVEGDRKLSVLLGDATRRGVRVLVLYDAVGSLTTDAKFLEGLQLQGVHLCAFNPLNPLDKRFDGVNQRDHRKIVVADGAVGFTGGVNFSQAYRIASKQARRAAKSKRPPIDEGWRDTHIELRGTAVAHLERLFRETWADEKCADVLPPPIEPQKSPDNVLVQIIAGKPQDDTNDIYLTLLSVLTYAQRSVDITMAYFVPDDTFENAIKAAARRGVRVRIILPSYSDFSGVFYAGRAHYDELLEAGVELYELESAFLHSKTIVVDGVWSSVGSTNFDWRSFVHNHEISVCVIDEAFAREMAKSFDADLAESRRITVQSWRKRPWRERLKELLWLPLQYYL